MSVTDRGTVRLLREIDIEAARRIWFSDVVFPVLRDPKEGDITILAGIHKARVAHKAMTAAEKRYSRRWLFRHGYGVPQ